MLTKTRTIFVSLFAMLSMFAMQAHAADPDYSSITGAVDWAGVVIGVLAIGAALAGVYVARKGVTLILSMFGR